MILNGYKFELSPNCALSNFKRIRWVAALSRANPCASWAFLHSVLPQNASKYILIFGSDCGHQQRYECRNLSIVGTHWSYIGRLFRLL